MRRGAQSLGTDIPSEREINRLTARGEDEFRLFEEMDEERRKKEGYKSRLMEEHEVPEWVFSFNKNENQLQDVEAGEVLTKRKRKDITYTDSLTEAQWFKALEGDDTDDALQPKRLKKDSESQLHPVSDPDRNREYPEGKYSSPAERRLSYVDDEYSNFPEQSVGKRKATEEFHAAGEPSTHVEQTGGTKKLQVLKLKNPRKHAPAAEESPAATAAVPSSNNLQNSFDEYPMNWKGLRRKRSSHGAHPQTDENGQSSLTEGSKDCSEDY
jgi:SWI/SNF-related matrix-associated actin-dependent regulator of chromatin subfamily A protein 2/4